MSYHLDPEEIAARRKLFAGYISTLMPAPEVQEEIRVDPKVAESRLNNAAWQRDYYARKKKVRDRRQRGAGAK